MPNLLSLAIRGAILEATGNYDLAPKLEHSSMFNPINANGTIAGYSSRVPLAQPPSRIDKQFFELPNYDSQYHGHAIFDFEGDLAGMVYDFGSPVVELGGEIGNGEIVLYTSAEGDFRIIGTQENFQVRENKTPFKELKNPIALLLKEYYNNVDF